MSLSPPSRDSVTWVGVISVLEMDVESGFEVSLAVISVSNPASNVSITLCSNSSNVGDSATDFALELNYDSPPSNSLGLGRVVFPTC